MKETEVDVDTAIPLGLIINEILTNSFKYAFPRGQDGQIDIQFSTKDAEQFNLNVSDNGIGNESTSTGFGTKLISLLTKQLGAKLSYGNENGYWTRIQKV